MKPDHHESIVGPWAEDKLDFLGKYLEAYNVALSKTPFRRVYIDGFAGSPVCQIRQSTPAGSASSAFLDDRETREAQIRFIAGSPLRALQCDPGFHLLRFFDLDDTRAGVLRRMAAEDDRIQVRTGDCNPALCELASNFGAWDLRGVAFLDPYGAHLEWKTLEAIAATEKIEAIINFPAAMAINRLLVRDGDLPQKWSYQLDACFGTHDWYDVVYAEEADLFGVTLKRKGGNIPEKLLTLYVERLGQIFPYVASPRLITNTRGVGLYYLLWAGPERTGYRIASDIIRRYARVPGQKGRTWRR